MYVWIVEVDWGRDDYQAIVGIAATREVGQRMAERHAEEHNYSIMLPWKWETHDGDYPYSHYHPYDVRREEVLTA